MRPRRRAMTLVELAIVVCGVGIGLFLLTGWMENTQQQAKHDLAVRMLGDLEKALARYRRATGIFPPSHGPGSAILATVVLLDHDRSRPILEAFPSSLWQGPGKRNLIDPWGTPLRYFSADSGSKYVQANGNRPVFVSAGPDQALGDVDVDPAGLGDNLRSDDPGPNDFQLYDALREAAAEEE